MIRIAYDTWQGGSSIGMWGVATLPKILYRNRLIAQKLKKYELKHKEIFRSRKYKSCLSDYQQIISPDDCRCLSVFGEARFLWAAQLDFRKSDLVLFSHEKDLTKKLGTRKTVEAYVLRKTRRFPII